MKTYTYWNCFLEVGQDWVDLFSFIIGAQSEDAMVVLEISLFGFYVLLGYSY